MHYFYVYILKCSDNSYYIGHTDNLEQRIAEHHAGHGSKHTSKRLPIQVVYNQAFQDRDEAFVIERKLKGWSRAKKEALIQGDFELIIKLSHNKTS